MSDPSVTVITATYNSGATLRLSLESLLAQDFKDFEAWVIGDATTDDSESVVAALGDPRLHWHNLPVNSGNQGEPNNEGLRRARGSYIAYLGHDDLWFPWHLSGLVGFQRQTGADLVHSLVCYVGPLGVLGSRGPATAGRTYDRHWFPPSSWLHRRDVVEKCGPWRDHRALPHSVDYDLSRRLFLAGRRIDFWPELSVLKFPSQHFSAYAPTGIPPQAIYHEEMERTPDGLARRVLLESAIAQARRRRPADEPIAQQVRRILQTLRARLYRAWGTERWPLASFLCWRYRRSRKRSRARRGLPRDPDA